MLSRPARDASVAPHESHRGKKSQAGRDAARLMCLT